MLSACATAAGCLTTTWCGSTWGGANRPVEARYCVSADVAPTALPAERVTELRQFVRDGGGLVLTGLAACLVDTLRLDSCQPNEAYWGTMRVPGGGAMKWKSMFHCGRGLGLKPIGPAHRLFTDLPGEGFSLWEFDESELVSSAVWRRRAGEDVARSNSAWPTRGKVLAGYYSDGAAIPDEFAVVVEYTQAGAGKVLVVGDGIDPHLGAAGSGGRRVRTGSNYDILVRNLIDYCARDRPRAAERRKARE